MVNKNRKKTNPKLNFYVVVLLFFALILSFSANSFNFLKANKIAENIIKKTKEANRPVNLKITIISDSSCPDCFDVNPIIKKIKAENVNIKEEKTLERTDKQAQELISKYAIKKLPAFIISGEIEKNSALKESLLKIGKIEDGSIVFKSATAPYIQADSGKVRGKVKLIMISDENCTECFDVNKYKGLPTQMKMDITEQKTIDYKSAEGKAIIKKNNIKLIPTIVIAGDLEAYSIKTLKRFGKIKNDNFVLTQIQPPYIDVASGKLMGKINIAIISDESCKDCYNVAVYDNIIKKFGLFVQNKKTIDVNSAKGKYLIKKYKIEVVPTIIMTGDVETYDKPGSVWSGIGTTEKDGAYIIREKGVKQLGTYKNLISGKIISSKAK